MIYPYEDDERYDDISELRARERMRDDDHDDDDERDDFYSTLELEDAEDDEDADY